LFFERGNGAGEDAEDVFVAEGFLEIIVLSNLVEDVAAEFDKGGELDLERIGGAQRGGMESLSKLSDDSRIEGVGLGETAFGFGEVSDLAGIDAGNGTTLSVGLGDESGFVAAAGLADEHGVVGQRFEVGADGFLGVWDLSGLAVVMDVEEEF